MLSIVLADDEPNILELIKRLIEHPDAKIVGEALNGIDAYDIVMDKKPDILITDIRMPGLNGIELIEKVQQSLPDIEIVVVSGYREFNYVQSVLKFGVQEYLLKPIEKKDINNLICRVIEKKKGVSEHKKYVRNIEQDLAKSFGMLRKEYLLKFFLFDNDFKVASSFKHLFKFKPGKFCVAVLKVDFHNSSPESDVYITPLLKNLSNKLLAIFKPECIDAEYVCYGTRSYFLFNYLADIAPSKFWNKAESGTVNINDILINDGYKYKFLNITFGVGSSVNTINELPASYYSAQAAVANRLNPNLGVVIECDALNINHAAGDESVLDEQDQQSLMTFIEALDAKKIDEMFVRMLDRLIIETENYGLISSLFTQILKLVKNTLITKSVVSEDEFPSQTEVFNHMDNCTKLLDIKGLFSDYIKDIMQFCRDLSDTKVSKPIRLAQKYVDENYASNITLQEVSDLVFLSSNYFSTTFKSQTGMNFIDYVKKVRIEEAKNMLRKSLMNVSEIAHAVGYTDVKYFSKLFIKVVGIKPIDYRKFYS